MSRKLSSKKAFSLWVALVLLAGVASGSLLGLYLGLSHDLPSIQKLENFQPSAVTRVFSADGQEIAEFFVEKRVPVPLDRIPAYLKDAVIATEDRRFYQHAGLDWRGILRAVCKDILSMRLKQGGSTITQQLAKILFLNPEKTLTRKLKEAILALQIERRYRKDEILALYLNQIYLGSGAYGVEAAANTYFGKHVWQLDLAECALIAGLPRAPNRYSPLLHPDRAMQRRAAVLKNLLHTGYITAEQYSAASAKPLQLAAEQNTGNRAPYFVSYLRPKLEKILGENLLYRGGLRVSTTLRADWQQAARSALESGLEVVDRRHPESREQVEGAIIVLDVHTGMIRAMVGGRSHDRSKFNRAVQAKRQPGSAFKPIIYAYALEHGYTQASRIWDAPISYPQKNGGRWQPQNYSGTYEGEITLRRALEISQNIVAIKLLERLGVNPVIDFAHRLGIKSNLQPNLSLALGTSEVSLLELVSAYQAFANGGIWIEPAGITAVVDSHNRPVWQNVPNSSAVLTQEAAYILTDMLRGVIKRGTGRAAARLPWPLAGKTGTTEANRDALFVGYSPQVAVGVWVGYDSSKSLGRGETGARAALPIWKKVMRAILPQTERRDFERPDTVILVQMDEKTGKRATQQCRDAVTAAFVKGTEPGEYCEEGSETSGGKFY
ncbi:MAG: PBP1A family penicillin-binding protein [Deltaproteobacteria bacterium]|nr:PBP1A family penicillin-binding protein [Deltaproteobacteria bacterium]